MWDYLTFAVFFVIGAGGVGLAVFVLGLAGRIAIARKRPVLLNAPSRETPRTYVPERFSRASMAGEMLADRKSVLTHFSPYNA
jgi:hypothetical protein